MRCKEPDILNQIYSIKNISFDQFYQTKSRESKSTESEVQSQLELSLAQLSPSLFVYIDNIITNMFYPVHNGSTAISYIGKNKAKHFTFRMDLHKPFNLAKA